MAFTWPMTGWNWSSNNGVVMNKKNLDRIKQTLVYIAWGLLAMGILFILMLVAALIGWGV